MGNAQFVQVIIQNKSAVTLQVKNAQLAWGKFYTYPNKDAEISPADVDKYSINSQAEQSIASCGRDSASSGTQGSFDLYDGDNRAMTIVWDNPYLAGAPNNFEIDNLADNWFASPSPWPVSGPALGTVTVKVINSPSH